MMACKLIPSSENFVSYEMGSSVSMGVSCSDGVYSRRMMEELCFYFFLCDSSIGFGASVAGRVEV